MVPALMPGEMGGRQAIKGPREEDKTHHVVGSKAITKLPVTKGDNAYSLFLTPHIYGEQRSAPSKPKARELRGDY